MAPFLTILVDATIKGTLVLTAAGALTLLLRHASAAFRHLVWFLALASLLVLPILSAALPAWRVPILPPVVPAPLSAEAVSRAGPPPPTPDEGSGQRDALRTIADFQKSAIPALGVQEDGENARFAPAARLRPLPPCDWAIGVLGLWGVGMLGAMGVLLAGTARVWRLTRRSTAITEPVWTSLLNELASTRRVRLLGSEQALIPMTWGVWRPVILLPSGAGDWPAERRRVVLTHELAHVRRLDYLTQTIAWFACALHWFNPLAWFALRRMRVEREQACDDYVLNAGLKPSDYASHLLDIVRSLRPLRASSIAAVAMARPSRLGRRVEAVLDIRRSRRAATRSLVLLAAAVALCILIPLGTLRPVAKAQEARVQTPADAEAGKKAEDASAAPRRASQPEGELGKVTGRVEDDEGQPVKGVRVAVAPRDVRHRLRRALPTSTDPQGRFALHLPPGKWQVRVLGEGALAGVVAHDAAVDVEVADGKATEPVVLTIGRLGVFGGKLVGPRGEPVGKAKITRLGRERDKVADDDGAFALSLVRFGEPFGLYASSQERALGIVTQVMPEKGRTEPLVVTLADLVEVKGKVEDGDGQPAKQAVVVACTLFDLLGSVVVCPVESVTTDENGLFTVKLPPGKWRVEPAESEEIAPVSPQAQTEVEVTPGKPVDHVNLRMRRTVKARGVVVGLDGKPMTDATVKVDFRPQPHSSGEKGLASDGTFTVEGVVPDERFTVLAFSRDRSLGVLAEVTVRKGQTEPVTVKLATCAKITGKVVDEQGQPLISAYVRASREVSDRGRRTRFYPPLVTIQTDAQGCFTVRLPPSTGYELIADTWGYVGARIPNLAAEGEKDIGTVVLKKADAFVAGKVTDANGKPVQGARVRVLSEAQPWLASSFVTTDAQGRYRIEGLAPDKVSVRAQHGQTHATREGVETGAGNVDIVLAPR